MRPPPARLPSANSLAGLRIVSYAETMIRCFSKPSSIAALFLLLGPAHGQDVDFCTLLEGRITAGDGQFIGRITPDTDAVDSIVNPLGDHGSEFRPLSILNPFGTYGAPFSLYSPFNPDTAFPPTIVQRSQPMARLTVSEAFSPRVDPEELLAWLRSTAPESCFHPTPTTTSTSQPSVGLPTPTETATASATATSFDGTPSRTPPATPTRPSRPTPNDTPRRTRTESPTATTPSATPTRVESDDDGGCSVIPPLPNTAPAALLLALGALLTIRRRALQKTEPVKVS